EPFLAALAAEPGFGGVRPEQGPAPVVAGFDIGLRDREDDDTRVPAHAAPAAPRVLQRNALRMERAQAAHLPIRNCADLAQRHGPLYSLMLRRRVLFPARSERHSLFKR